MPGIDGFQACRTIRQLPGGADIPVLMLTGLEDVDSIARAYESGATDFATKTTPWQVLVQRARYMLRARWTLEALRRSEARQASAQCIARLGHWERDLRTGEFHWSDQLSRLFGFPLGTVVGDLDVLQDRIDPDDREAVRAARERLRQEAAYRVDFRVMWPDGTVRHMHEHAEALSDEHGPRARIVGTVQDITERKEAEPITIEGHEIVATASIGIGFFPNDGHDAETLLRNADAAMYHAKEQGRNGLQFYDRSMNERAVERLTLENELRRGLEGEQFVLHFQPRVNSQTGLISGAEALIRWRHPTRGLVLPQAFIPLAEETGLIVPIGEWVIRTACIQAKAWSQARFGPLPVSVNLSARQFKLGAIAEIVERGVAAVGLPPALLELEITESILMEGSRDTIDVLKALRARGILIAVDDFGTGYSSLSYLKRLPIDRLKIDRSFVRDVLTDPDDAALSEAIIVMARALRLETVAEGVENQAQADFLRERGCQHLQGYLFGRPVAAAAFEQERRRLFVEAMNFLKA